MTIGMSRSETIAAALLPQRVKALGQLGVVQGGGRSRLSTLFQEGAAKIRMPTPEGDWIEAVLINTAGGMTGCDRIAWQIDIGTGASATVTTQTCEKVYRSDHGEAALSATLSVGPGARLAWLPQETIVFDRSSFSRWLDLDVGEGATVLLAETTLFGRAAMGEAVHSGRFRDRWRVRSGGRIVHAEDFFVSGDISQRLNLTAVARGATAVSTVLMIGPDVDRHVDAARAIIGEGGGASAWTVGENGKFLARLYDRDGYCLRKRLVPLLALLNGRAGLPKTWSL